MPANPWDEAAAGYSRLVDSPDNMCYRALIDPYLKEFFGRCSGGQVLDLGCGDGYLSRQLPGDFSITGIDSSAELIRLAGEKKSRGEYVAGDITRPLAYFSEFDFVVSNMVLMSVADLGGAYDNAVAALKREGRFVMTILHPVFSRPTMRWFKTWPMKILRRDPFARIDAYGREFEKSFPILGLDAATPLIHRPLADYLQPAIDRGLLLAKITELYPSVESIRQFRQPGFLAKYPMVMALVWQK